jgi:hypothetical protein
MQRLLIALVFALRSFAALPSTTVWEVRPTVGSNTNGGGFVTGSSGTDWSQFNAAQYTLTNGVTNGTTTVATVSASADMVGNIAYIAGGTGSITAAWYQIVSQTTGVSIVVDRSTGLTAGTGVTINIGGALSTVAQANTNATASNTVYVKATGTYTVTTAMALTLNSAPTPSIPYSIIGYSSTRGDNGQFTWTTATNSVNLITATNAENVVFKNINFTTSAGTPAYGIEGGASGSDNVSIYFYNCKFSGFLIGIYASYNVTSAINGLFFINSRITASTTIGLENSATTYIFGSMIDNNTSDGGNWPNSAIGQSSSWVVQNSIFYKNGGHGINIAAQGGGSPVMVIQNSDFSTNTLNGIFTGNTLVGQTIISNSIFDANGAYGYSAGTGSYTMPWGGYNNAFYNNALGQTLNASTGIGPITLSASPYVSLGSLNFALNTTTGGGAALFNAGFPGVLANGGTGFLSVGALQPAASMASSSRGYPIVQ